MFLAEFIFSRTLYVYNITKKEFYYIFLDFTKILEESF